MAIPLTSRQVRTLEWLIEQVEPRSMSDAAEELRLTPRMVRSSLDGMERFLAGKDLVLCRQRGVGIWIEGSRGALSQLRKTVSQMTSDDSLRVYSADDRLRLVLFEQLLAAPQPLTIDQIQRTLHVSLTSARRDLARAATWLESQELYLARRPGVGSSVIGTEYGIRRALVKVLLETVPHPVFASDRLEHAWWKLPEIASGIRDLLEQVPLAECHAIVKERGIDEADFVAGPTWFVADLAIAAVRIRSAKLLHLEPGTLRSLEDHAVWETAEFIAEGLAPLVGGPLGEAEVGGIAERLLGIAQLSSLASAPASVGRIAIRATGIAAERLHPGLADDTELTRSLTSHIERLAVRLRYGLPVHNPLLSDVSGRYPEVHDVAASIADLVGNELGAAVSEDETGYITMYLSGALERLRLKPRAKAIVMCPSGDATAWILVSRIQAEFPELDIVEVLSATSLDEARDLDAAVVISTVAVPQPPPGVSVFVVNPLLPADDVRRLARAL